MLLGLVAFILCSASADSGSEWDVFTHVFELFAVLITCRGVQGNTWPLLEFRQAMDHKANHREAKGDAVVSVRDEEFLDYLAD